MYCVSTVGYEPAWPRDPKSLMSGIGPVVTFAAGTKHPEICNRSHVRTHAQSCAEIESSRARVLYIAPMGISRVATVARGCAHPILAVLPLCLRPSSFSIRTATSVVREPNPGAMASLTTRSPNTNLRGVHDKGATSVREPRDHFRSTPSPATSTAHWQNRTGHLRLRDTWASRRTMRHLQRPWRQDQ